MTHGDPRRHSGARRLTGPSRQDLALDRQIQCVLDGARQATHFDRMVLWAKSPTANALVYAGSAGLFAQDLHSLGIPLELPLTQAGALSRVLRHAAKRFICISPPLAARNRIKGALCDVPGLRSRSFVIGPLFDDREVLGLLVADNKYTRRRPLDRAQVWRHGTGSGLEPAIVPIDGR